MFFSKCEISVSSTGISGQRLAAGGYKLHKQVWRLFPNTEKREFLYRQVDDANKPTVYVVSRQEPVAHGTSWSLTVKDYRPCLVAGAHLAFSLRANPVVSRKNGTSNRGTRHDVVMNAKKESPDENPAELERQAGFEWLSKRAEPNGFSLHSVTVGRYQQHSLKKPSGNTIKFSTLDFDGVLTISDEEQLMRTLISGIGPAKGFGCGLLMIRPL